MATLYSDIYSLFLLGVESFQLQNKETVEELEDSLIDYLTVSCVEFDSCKVDLFDVDQNLKQFNQTLSGKEKVILSKYMILHWLQFHITTDTLLKQFMGDKDSRMTSQANHLNALSTLQERLKKELQSEVDKYLLRGGIFNASSK